MIVVEQFYVGGRLFNKTYSDAEGGPLLGDDSEAKEILNILMGVEE